jgi:hypothetical protein
MGELNLTIINKPPEGESFLQHMLLKKEEQHHMEKMSMFAEMLDRLKSMDSRSAVHHAGGGCIMQGVVDG